MVMREQEQVTNKKQATTQEGQPIKQKGLVVRIKPSEVIREMEETGFKFGKVKRGGTTFPEDGNPI